MLQILGLRPWQDAKGRWKNKEVFSDKGWRIPNVRSLFSGLDEVLAKIEKEEHWNLFFTVHHVKEEKGRVFEKGYLLTFDIDKIKNYNHSMAEGVAAVVANVLQVPLEKLAVSSSGNGVHVYMELTPEFHWDSILYFDKVRNHYNAVCDKITVECRKAGFEGADCDKQVWSKDRIFRLPKTKNVKRDKVTDEIKEKDCVLIKATLEPVAWDLKANSGLSELEAAEAVSVQAMKAYPAPDTAAVRSGCAFLKHCQENPAAVQEPEWYAMLTLTARIHKDHATSKQISHDMSKGHPNYRFDETESKIEQALNHGPRTCRNIHEVWGEKSQCRGCEHWGKIATPLFIHGEDYIQTETTGFRFMKLDKNGKLNAAEVDYEGLRRHFQKKHNYIAVSDTASVYVWNEKHWEEVIDLELRAFVQKYVDPMPKKFEVNEWIDLVYRTQQKRHQWFGDSGYQKMNFQNGVLDLQTMKFEPHNMSYGFRKILPYDYDPKATAPNFEQFLEDITLGRDELKKVLLEFSGYSLSNDPCWEHKACVLQGEGRNGKSTFVNILRALAGEGNYTSMSMLDLEKDTNRYALDGSMFNVSEETPNKSLLDSSLFKLMVAGGKIQIKQLYKQPYEVVNRAKMWLLCNEMPRIYDLSFALINRLLIIPFEATFTGPNVDKHIDKKLFQELPGILNMMLAAYREMRERGHIFDSKVVEQAVQNYREEMDAVQGWWNERVEVSDDRNKFFVAKKELYQQYRQDAETDGDKPVNSARFYRSVRRFMPDLESRIENNRVNGRRDRVIYGVRLLGENL